MALPTHAVTGNIGGITIEWLEGALQRLGDDTTFGCDNMKAHIELTAATCALRLHQTKVIIRFVKRSFNFIMYYNRVLNNLLDPRSMNSMAESAMNHTLLSPQSHFMPGFMCISLGIEHILGEVNQSW